MLLILLFIVRAAHPATPSAPTATNSQATHTATPSEAAPTDALCKAAIPC